ncbi:MAG TPA: hypothetical protein VI298_13705 [Geobacteraceae bacterium]
MQIQISIPFAVDLTKENNWNKAKNHPYGYWIIRCHFQVRERQANEIARYGRKLAVFEFVPGVEPEIVRSIKSEVTNVCIKESFVESLRQNESMQALVTSLASSIGASAFAKVSTESKAEAQLRLIESIKQGFKIQSVVTQRDEREYKLTYKIDPSKTTRLVAVAMHQRYIYDLYLTWVDYLSVRYLRGPLGIRKKRMKRPIVDGNNHQNWIKYNIPIASVYFWHPLPESAVVIKEIDYQNQVENEEEAVICPPEDSHQYFASKPDVPTLYQISNVAFPFKWVKRKGEWTEEELRKIEEGNSDEIKWFWEETPEV